MKPDKILKIQRSRRREKEYFNKVGDEKINSRQRGMINKYMITRFNQSSFVHASSYLVDFFFSRE